MARDWLVDVAAVFCRRPALFAITALYLVAAMAARNPVSLVLAALLFLSLILRVNHIARSVRRRRSM